MSFPLLRIRVLLRDNVVLPNGSSFIFRHSQEACKKSGVRSKTIHTKQYHHERPKWYKQPSSLLVAGLGLGLGLGAGMAYSRGVLAQQTAQVASDPLQSKPRYADREELTKVSVSLQEKSVLLMVTQAVEELRTTLGDEGVSTDEDELRRHGFSEWSSINIDTLPVAIAFPTDTKEVSAIAKICTKYRIPISTLR